MSDDKKELARRLQAMSDALQEPIELRLAKGPRPYQLSKCTGVGLNILDPNKAELLLATEQGHRILIEIDSQTAETLHDLLSNAFKGLPGQMILATHR